MAQATWWSRSTAHYHRADHSALDTRGCLMQWKNDKLTCWTNYYAADQTRMHISQMLGLPLNKVRVIIPYIGGQFGRCNMGEQPFFIFTALLAQRTGRPVRYKMTRREDFHDTRNAINYQVKLGAKKDGTIVAADFKALGDTGAYHGHGMAVGQVVVKWDVVENMMAHIPNLRYEGYVVYTNKIPGGCMRGIGNIQHNFAWGLAVDMLAREARAGPGRRLPQELRPRVGAAAQHEPGGGAADGARARSAGRTATGRERARCSRATKKRGIGFSCHCSWHAAWQEEMRGHVQVQIKLNPDMSVILKAPMVETGVGSNACVTFACAEALELPGDQAGRHPLDLRRSTPRPVSRTWSRPTAPAPTCSRS